MSPLFDRKVSGKKSSNLSKRACKICSHNAILDWNSQKYHADMLSLTEHAWEFQNDALWDTQLHALYWQQWLHYAAMLTCCWDDSRDIAAALTPPLWAPPLWAPLWGVWVLSVVLPTSASGRPVGTEATVPGSDICAPFLPISTRGVIQCTGVWCWPSVPGWGCNKDTAVPPGI